MKFFNFLPVRIIILILLIRRPTQVVNYQGMVSCDFMFDELVKFLPVPQTRFEKWVVTTIITWVDKERTALYELMDLNITAMGTLPK